MTYVIDDHVATWRGRPIPGADAASFKVVLPIVASDARHVYVLGKPTAIDRASFRVLSPCYVRDRNAVYVVMDTKLKLMSEADAQSFQAIGTAHGRDRHAAWFRDKKIRLGKGGSLADLRELATAFCTDGRWVYFGIQQQPLPTSLTVNWSVARLRPFSGGEVNCPPFAVDDGVQVVVRQEDGEGWLVLSGADFDSLTPFEPPEYLWGGDYLHDNEHVWYLDRLLEGVQPENARLIGRKVLAVGQQVYCGANLTMLQADNLRYVDSSLGGEIFHTGAALVALDAEKPLRVLATRPAQPLDIDATVSAAFASIFRLLFTVFDEFLPVQSSPYEVLSELGVKPETMSPSEIWSRLAGEPRPPSEPDMRSARAALVALPTYAVDLAPNGLVTVRRSDGSLLVEPASGWLGLACRFWAAERGRDERFLPYPALGYMLPSGDELGSGVLLACAKQMLSLAAALFEIGAETEARIVVHQMMMEAKVSSKPWKNPWLVECIAALPQELISEFHFRPIAHEFPATTHLAVARHIVRQELLAHPDWRIRLHMAGKIHAVFSATDKVGDFYAEVVPTLMARFDLESAAAVRERLAMAMEMALVRGHVRMESHDLSLCKPLLPLVDFCLQRGINTRFNRARLAETLWALGREEEGNAVAQSLLAEVGEMTAMQGIYVNRRCYRCYRIGLLAAKARAAWRDGSAELQRVRAAALSDEYAQLLERFGPEASQWDEMIALRKDIATYRERWHKA